MFTDVDEINKTDESESCVDNDLESEMNDK